MNGDGQAEDKGFSWKAIKNWLMGLGAALVVLPSLINTGSDIIRAILNLPIGGSERQNVRLMREHFEESALFKKDIEIQRENTIEILKIRVYENADIYVKYGGQEQWFSGNPEPDHVASGRFNLITEAMAGDTIDLRKKGTALPVLLEETETVKIDLQKIHTEKTRSLQQETAVIERSYLFAITNDFHNSFSPTEKAYRRSFQAEAGYVFKDVRLDIQSINHATRPKVSLSNDRRTLTVESKVTSGPMYNRWRGWVKAEVITRQEAMQ